MKIKYISRRIKTATVKIKVFDTGTNSISEIEVLTDKIAVDGNYDDIAKMELNEYSNYRFIDVLDVQEKECVYRMSIKDFMQYSKTID